MTARNWIFTVTFDGLLFALLYAWQVMGHEAAGSFFIVAMWALGALGVLALFCEIPKRKSLIAAIYRAILNAALIATFVYVGHVWLAGLRMTVWALLEARRNSVANPAGGAK